MGKGVGMFVTILSGQVTHENWSPLKKSYQQAVIKYQPEGLISSMLVQSEDDPALWQIISLWPDKETFTEAERKDQANICVKLFCKAGSIPNRRGYTLVGRYTRV